MLIIDWEKEITRINEEKGDSTADGMIWPIVERERDCHYYRMFGLKGYCTCKTEGLKRFYAQKIVDYVNSLDVNSDGQFSLEYVQYQNPKLDNGKFFAAVCNEMQPTKEE